MASLEPSAAVTRVIYLAYLSPSIVQAIVRGEQPMGLGTKKLLAMAHCRSTGRSKAGGRRVNNDLIYPMRGPVLTSGASRAQVTS